MGNSTVKFFSVSSGSCGNCYFLSLEEDGVHSAGVVIDAGVSLRRLKKGLAANGYDMDSFSAILVTHDHLDHIRHLGAYCKHLCKPVYATPVLHGALSRHPFTSPWIGGCSTFQSSTGPIEWHTRVVMRSRTGTLNFSESSNARIVRS